MSERRGRQGESTEASGSSVRHKRRDHQLETIGRIAGQVAHDLANLLGPLALYPDLIKAQLPPDHRAIRYCDAMLDCVRRMTAINSDMLVLARKGHTVKQPTDLNLLVRQTVAEMGQIPATLHLSLHLEVSLPPVYGASAQLSRVISNLLWNAREAMADRGVISVSTESVFLESPFGRYDRVVPGEYVKLSVEDTGPGIPAEIRDRIFEAFFTTKAGTERKGFGLGLSIVESVVEDHRGYVDVETEVGLGSRFRVHLPVAGAPSVATRPAVLPGGRECVLIVDDDETQRELMQEALSRLGYRVSVAGGGEEALKMLSAMPIDLLVLDMVMPGGIDGAETFKRALEVCPGIRTVILSGFAEAEQVGRAKGLGAGTYVRKPVGLEELAAAVRSELDRPKASA